MNTKLNRVENRLELAKEVSWSVRNLAKCCSVSVRVLELHFRRQTGKTPKEWLIEQRQKQAMKLLSKGFSVKETAICLGFKHPQHFSRQFKNHWGFRPTQSVKINSSKMSKMTEMDHF